MVSTRGDRWAHSLECACTSQKERKTGWMHLWSQSPEWCRLRGKEKKYKAEFGAGCTAPGESTLEDLASMPSTKTESQTDPKRKGKGFLSALASRLPGWAVPAQCSCSSPRSLKGYFPHRALFTGLLQHGAKLRTALSPVQLITNPGLYGSLEFISRVAKQDSVNTHQII